MGNASVSWGRSHAPEENACSNAAYLNVHNDSMVRTTHVTSFHFIVRHYPQVLTTSHESIPRLRHAFAAQAQPSELRGNVVLDRRVDRIHVVQSRSRRPARCVGEQWNPDALRRISRHSHVLRGRAGEATSYRPARILIDDILDRSICPASKNDQADTEDNGIQYGQG